MKKSFLIAAIALVCGTMAYAQPRAIGGRLGWNEDFVYQHSLSDKTFIELNAGVLGFSGAHIDFLHEWIWLTPNWTERGEWNWFAGVGANVGWLWSDLHPVKDNTGFVANYNAQPLMAGAVANIGLEYTFWFPLSLAVDYRPTFGALIGKDAGSTMMSDGTTVVPFRFYMGGLFDIAISVRYRFGMRD